MNRNLPTLLCLIAAPALAGETRQMDAHVHGVGEMNIAIDGEVLDMDFHVPGADIVGFEYEAKTAEDRAAIENAVAVLSRPRDLFVLPKDAGCTLTGFHAALEGDEDHDHEGHDDHEAHDHKHEDHVYGHDHKHDDHADHDDHKHDDHDHKHDDHAEGHDHKHDDHAEGHDHKHDDHAEGHDHDDHDHGDEATHSEFHAKYRLTCADPAALTNITFAYFEKFENAREVDVQVITDKGAKAFEVTRDAPVLDLSGL